ncbi:helix-turn-helix transcriptional regulator [Corynebacterium pseudotuberculosis]|uniref:helix-turn-helix transcriptional regulator n=1 Tax=Corynebacterium pseudotuberculosis TaxID=1719 RepID=UPI0002660B09|nr:WYL domain-containing protein [Corynebacterium pseudotuberculosis]AFM07377.1 WYL domain-containing protein [Corynebacterium pseudotuberculosis Cp162]APG81599.1 Protein pafC [Corynebacterium pseudotuberculosis]
MATSRSKNRRLTDLVRLLNLLPYFEAHPGRSMMEAATDLGLPPSQVQEDLSRLFCCGPGTFPDELVDLDAELRSVTVINNQGMDSPLRLTHTEASALLLALETLEQVPGLVKRSAVLSAAEKIRQTMGKETHGIFDSTSLGNDLAPEPNLEIIRESMSTRTQIEFDYYNRNRDEMSHRVVSASRIFTHGGETYLTAWEESSESHRTFRVSAMSSILATNLRATPRLERATFDDSDPFNFSATSEFAKLELSAEALWMADTIPLKIEKANSEGWYEGTLPLVSREWVIQFVLSNRDRVRVIAPHDLAQAVQDRAKIALSVYDPKRVTSSK